MSRVAAEMGGQQPGPPAAQVAVVAGPERQANVIGYQAVGEDAHPDADALLGHHVDERIVLVGPVEDGGSPFHAQGATTRSLVAGHRYPRCIRRVRFPPRVLEGFPWLPSFFSFCSSCR
jgi:hypothetical protein